MVRKRRNQKEIHTPKTEVGKTKLTIRHQYLQGLYLWCSFRFCERMDAFYKQIHRNTQFYFASRTSQGSISFVVLHVFVSGFGIDF